MEISIWYNWYKWMELCGHHPTFLSLLVCLRVLFLDLLLLSDYFFRGEKIKTSRVFFAPPTCNNASFVFSSQTVLSLSPLLYGT